MKMKIEEPEMQEMMRGVRDADEEEEEPQEVKPCKKSELWQYLAHLISCTNI